VFDIQDGYFYCIEWDKFITKGNGNKSFISSGAVRLKIVSLAELREITGHDISEDFDLYPLDENNIDIFKPYMVEPLVVDFDSCEYCVSVCLEDWLQEERDKEDEERLKKWMEGLPDPKIVFALLVLEKGEEMGDGYEMPLYGIEVSEVRAFFGLSESQSFEWEIRLDKRMYDFIADRIKCNNINMDKYDYKPIFRYNNYPDLDDVIVVPCHIDDESVS
jgi:hypothetical protein